MSEDHKTIPHATKIIPTFSWNNLVLPKSKIEQLHKICDRVKRTPIVYRSLEFEKHSHGRGVCVLFCGAEGTGKTMAAQIIAGELGLDLYQIDLSLVVSKYIGETEKNLVAIFSAAENGGSLLFFDEADALFGKRTPVKDSHDRYANIELNYLLQKLEGFLGLAIISTSKNNIDPAFVMRMHFVVDFPISSVDEPIKFDKNPSHSKHP
jgi:SpoVK/Ycf46/Vps4 family AAA+-type ATPase